MKIHEQCKALTNPVWYRKVPVRCSNKATKSGYCRSHDPLLRCKRRDFDKEIVRLNIALQKTEERGQRIGKRISVAIAEKKRCEEFLKP